MVGTSGGSFRKLPINVTKDIPYPPRDPSLLVSWQPGIQKRTIEKARDLTQVQISVLPMGGHSNS